MSRNLIKTWVQGRFIDGQRYRNWPQSEKDRAQKGEERRVRPSPTGNAICHTERPEDAVWIAQRLNLASELEELVWKFVQGDATEVELSDFVRRKLDS